jgi:hypothetical protein
MPTRFYCVTPSLFIADITLPRLRLLRLIPRLRSTRIFHGYVLRPQATAYWPRSLPRHPRPRLTAGPAHVIRSIATIHIAATPVTPTAYVYCDNVHRLPRYSIATPTAITYAHYIALLRMLRLSRLAIAR